MSKSHDLLKEGSELVGVLFDIPLTEDGPPFGGDLSVYQNLFRNKFKINVMELSYNSIKPRKNSELFIVLKKIKWKKRLY